MPKYTFLFFKRLFISKEKRLVYTKKKQSSLTLFEIDVKSFPFKIFLSTHLQNLEKDFQGSGFFLYIIMFFWC